MWACNQIGNEKDERGRHAKIFGRRDSLAKCYSPFWLLYTQTITRGWWLKFIRTKRDHLNEQNLRYNIMTIKRMGEGTNIKPMRMFVCCKVWHEISNLGWFVSLLTKELWVNGFWNNKLLVSCVCLWEKVWVCGSVVRDTNVLQCKGATSTSVDAGFVSAD